MAYETKPAWKDVMIQEGLDDMTLLSKVTNEQICDNLRQRYQKNIIYTSISDVLISMNPYKWIEIYGPEIVQDYVGRSRIELPPHIFSIAEEAFRTMLNEKENQCVIISGESGAGKTEAAKKIMFYIAEVTGDSGELERVKNIILETNPLLEAFGNAKTLRNNNSSRFGKYFELHFTKEGDPTGGVITNYLLEKARVAFQIPGERNFHIFYQFCKGASAQEKQSFGIQGPEAFWYTSYGNCPTVQGIDDLAEWKDTRHAMDVIGISKQEQNSILKILAAILWIGNMQYSPSADKVSIEDKSVLNYVADIIGVKAGFLQNALESRTVETKHGMKRGTSYKVPLNGVQAAAARDGLAKTVYSRLFDWLVQRLNQALVTNKKDLSIGVLDIYGFEVFEKNSFEQLCINYVNEKLQQIFIQYTLKNEQEEYVREGIKWTPIEYFNNKIVCDLIEEKNPPGIFSILDDVCKTVHALAEGADQALAQRITGCNNNQHFNLRGKRFLVKHYAGDVTYEIEGLVEKNKDTLSTDLVELVQSSSDKFLVALFPEDTETDRVTSTAGNKIKTSANLLVKALSLCHPHYVRCLKPNDDKTPDYFVQDRVLHQVRYLGLLDNVKVRRSGFAYRTTFEKFLERYYLISARTSYAASNIWKGDVKSGCRAILEDAPVGPQEWQIGKTKVFLKSPETLFAFEDLRVNYYHNMASRIKSAFRIFKTFRDVSANRIKNAFKIWKQYRFECVQTIQRLYRSYKGVAPYMDLKLRTESLIGGRKQRQRFSLTSVRRFVGDYLDLRTQNELLQAMGTGASEPILFTSKGSRVVHPGVGALFGKSKLSPRFIILTQNALYLIKLEVKKNLAMHILERNIPLATIQTISQSTLFDQVVVLHISNPANEKEDYDAVLVTEFKTEFIGWLNAYGQVQNRVTHANMIEYTYKKGSKKKLEFAEDTIHKNAAENPFYKDGKWFTSAGQPASSQVKSYQYKLKAPPKPAREKPDEFGAQKKKANATAAIRGTTKVATGAKNTVDISKLTHTTGASPTPRAQQSAAARPLKPARNAQGVSPRLQSNPSGRRGPKPTGTAVPARRAKPTTTNPQIAAPQPVQQSGGDESRPLPSPQRRGPGPGPARRGPGPSPNANPNAPQRRGPGPARRGPGPVRRG